MEEQGRIGTSSLRARARWWVLPAALLAGTHGRGQQAASPLQLPSAVAFDHAGDLYVAETGRHDIREYLAGGALITVAGDGVQGFAGDGGPAVLAELDSPEGLAVDASGNLYIADTHNNRVRKVAAGTGIISTIAGNGVAGFSGDGGAATQARLDAPSAVSVDASGDIYVADTRNHRVRRILAANGTISTVAGDGVAGDGGDGRVATSAELDSPRGVAVDAGGNLLIGDTRNGRLRRVDVVTGTISTIAGVGVVEGNLQRFGGDGGAATAAGLALPRGVAVDAAGNMYVADQGNQRIRRISPTGTISTVAGDGVEGFAGDGGAAVVASIDRPRGVAISPGELVTIADTGNGRVRQLDPSTSLGPDIDTVSSVSSTGTDALTLSGPANSTYGSGTVTATVASAVPATGAVTLSDVASGTAVPLGSAGLSGGVATFSLGELVAGTHMLVATYPGDAGHKPADSAIFGIAIAPLAITATPTSVSVPFGQAIAPIAGALTGVLPQDSGRVSAVFASTAVVLSPVGSYPIAATLLGDVAGNYDLHVAPARLTITPAASVTSLMVSSTNLVAGLPGVFTVATTSTTSGIPTGTVTLLDGGSTAGTASLSAAGSASFPVSSLAQGSHTITATYGGDRNFLPSVSSAASVVVSASPDFAIVSSGASSETVPAGSAATFNFSVTLQGAALSSPIVLAVQGVPAGAAASVNPGALVPGGPGSFVLTIQTPMARMDAPPLPGQNGGRTALGLLVPLFGVLKAVKKKSRRSGGSQTLAAIFCITLLSLLAGCGDRVNLASGASNAKRYTITVSGTATGPAGGAIQHSANVTLEVI